jgi:hypothetical protein
MVDQVFVHMELHGSHDRLVGFVEGLREAAGEAAVWFCSEDGYALDSLVDTIKEKIGLETHVVLSLPLARQVEARLAESPAVKATVAWTKEVDHAELSFTYRCFSRDVGAEVRQVIEGHLPDGVRLEGYEVNESEVPDGEGVELYSPVHAYTVSGAGRYVGPVPAVFELADRLRDQDFIEPDPVRFVYA